MMPGKLIVLTGPAAVGKSTLAKALQAEFSHRGELCLTIELDVFARSLPRDWIGLGNHQGLFAERGFVYSRTNDGSIELTLGPDARRVLAAFHRSVAAVVTSGVDVVCETIVYDDEDWSDWLLALQSLSVCWVKLTAPLAVLEAREQAERTRVFQGLARGMSARRSVGKYDFEVDTSAEAMKQIVDRIMANLAATRQ